MNPELLKWVRTYNFDGREVAAKVETVNVLPGGAVEVMVRTSCVAPAGGEQHQTNTSTLTDSSGGAQLESFMRSCAEWLKKLLWEKPRILMFVAQMPTADGKKINVTCKFNLASQVTCMDPAFVEITGLPKIGEFVPAENPRITLPMHKVHLCFGEREFDLNVVAVNVGAMCVIGSDLVLQAIGANTEFLYDLFLTDIVRTISHVARSKNRTVLILGSYTAQGRERLALIRKRLDHLGLKGVILDDFVDIHQQSLFEKMLMFGSLSRFIVCDESVASGHLIELKACSDIGFVTAILRAGGKSVTWMNADIAADRAYMKIFAYADDSELEERISEASDWAEQKIQERAKYYNDLYAWRNPNVKLAGS